jgi:hypothetical protein
MDFFLFLIIGAAGFGIFVYLLPDDEGYGDD